MKYSFSGLLAVIIFAATSLIRPVFADSQVGTKQMLYDQFRRDAYDISYPEIDFPTLEKVIKARQAFLIDANSEKVYKEEGHITGSYSLSNLYELKKNLPILKEYPIIVYCYRTECNAWQRAADYARAMGYKSILHFKPGLKGWRDQGGLLEK